MATENSSIGDLSGRQLGGYRLLRRLGRGAMAEVYLAEQESLRRQVALKVLKSDLAADQTYVKRFHREARAAASLVHANIVQIHEVGCAGQTYYIAQEYVQGLNLRQWLARHGPPDLRLALAVLRQVAAALAKAADEGIVHRDIKPENIMIGHSGEVKVADFGLARVARPGEGTDLTQAGMTLGTPLYMSPEQIEGRALDPRSDLYSLGVTCYHVLAGTTPFSGATALSVALQHLKKAPAPLEVARPDLPPSLCRLVHKLMAKDPAARFQTARELLADLRRIQIEHVGDDWPDDIPAWESEGPLTARLRSETTQRLGTLMKSASQAALRRPRLAWWAAGWAAAFLAGAVAAWYTTGRQSVLADAAPAALQVPKEDNPWAQLVVANQLGTEEGWRALLQYYPDRTYFANQAKQRLAMIYLREDRLDEALLLFDELIALGDAEPEARAFGLAGRCGILSIEGKYDESTKILTQLSAVRDDLKDPQMWQLVGHAVRKNRSELGEKNSRELEEWLKQRLPEGD